MRIVKYIVGCLIFEALFADGFIHLFLWTDEAHELQLVFGFTAVQFALIVATWWWIEQKRNHGKSRSSIKRKSRERSRRLSLFVAVLFYLLRVSLGIYRLIMQGWSGPIALMLLAWSIGLVATFYVLSPNKTEEEIETV